ncbi:isopeptide-forming domain-containing fimbrial protein, partial [Streptococcus pluranimalium]
KASLPTTITSYKKFVITDTLDKDLMVKGTPSITGDVAKFFDVKVDGQTVTATMKDFAKAGDFAGKEVELVIPAQIREGVTRVKIPNTTKVVYNNSTVDGEPDEETPPTPPVTVTPPTDPTVDKKINGDKDHLDVPVQTDYTYNIKASLPTTITSYKKFVITDTLDKDLMVKGTPSITGDVAKFFDVKVDGQTVTATMKDFAKAGDFAGKEVELVIPAQIREGVTRVKIPNTTKVVYHNPGIDDEPERETPPTPPVTVTPPTDPTVDKKINRTLEHLDIERNKSYMYNIYAEIPGDIENYTEYVVTDDVDPALGINGDVAVHVDGYTTDAFKVTVEGNKVTATVVDFAKLEGYKQVQIYIPAYIKEDADLTTYVDTKVPNTASLEFANASGIKKRKETKPVTVTPPTPPTPPTPEPPKPGEPVKTVSNVEGAEQALSLKLAQATDAFRFDVKSVVPIDNSIDNRTILTSLTLMDTLDDNLKVSRVGVKVIDTPSITTPATDFNFIDEDVEVAKQELDEARQKLEALQKDTSTESQEKVAAAEAKVTELQQQLSEAQAVLEQLKVSATTVETTTESSTETTTETSENSQTQIQHQENVVAALKAQLAEAKLEVETVKAEIANAKTAEELKVEVSNQQAIVDKAQVKLTEAEAKQKLVKEKLDLFTQVTEKGELTAEAIEKLGGTIKVDGQNVTVDFSDEATMEALKGRTVTMIIYAEIKDVKALKDVHFSEGIDNTATVQFNHDPSVDLTKDTNKVTVVPPSPNPPTPPGNTPPGNTPPGNTPPGNTPPGNTPPTPPANHKPNLPATGDSTTYLAVVLGVMSLGLGLGAWVMRKKRD